MQRRPEPLQTTRLLGVGALLWLINAVLRVLAPTITSVHVGGFFSVVLDWTFWGGLLFLGVGMFLRATAWAQNWRDGTDAIYERPGDFGPERPAFPPEDDPDF